MLNVVMLSVVMLSLVAPEKTPFTYCYAECHYAECRGARKGTIYLFSLIFLRQRKICTGLWIPIKSLKTLNFIKFITDHLKFH
jgi:hypothetical protein